MERYLRQNLISWVLIKYYNNSFYSLFFIPPTTRIFITPLTIVLVKFNKKQSNFNRFVHRNSLVITSTKLFSRVCVGVVLFTVLFTRTEITRSMEAFYIQMK